MSTPSSRTWTDGPMEHLEIIETLKHFPDQLTAEIADLPDATLRLRPAENEWSIKEIVGHLWYADEVWYKRLYVVWSLTDPVLMSFDPDAERAAAHRAYDATDLQQCLAELRLRRPRIVDLLSHAVDWTRIGQWLGV